MKEYMSLKSYVYQYISEKINSGLLTGDDKINEVQISEELDVSRTPIREALVQLASDGYLENIPRKGFKVKRIDTKTTIELYEIIGALDGKAGSLSIDYVTDEDIAEMSKLLQDMHHMIISDHHEKYNDLQLKFHEVYISKCHNFELISLLKKLKMNFIRKNYSVTESDDIKAILLETNNEHKEILALIQNKDKLGLQNYLSDVHWSSDKAKFDSW